MKTRNYATPLILLFLSAVATAQPRRTACLQWDQAYHQVVILGIAAAAILSLVLWLIVSFALSRHVWWAASPRSRVWISAFWAGTLVELLVVGWPRLFGFGRGLFAAVDPQYLDCQAAPFGAPGLLSGLIGQGVAAFSQWPAITGLLYGASLIGGTIAWLISEAFVRTSGLQSTARGGEV